MKTTDHLTKWIRLVIAAAMAIAVGLVVTPGGVSNVAQAADVAPATSFQIDGNRLGPNDFDAPYPAGVTPAPENYPTTGMYFNAQYFDEGLDNGCAINNDPSVAVGGVKLEDGPIWPSPGTADPNGKTDLNFIDIAAEKVDKNGDIFDILYVGYEKCGGSGTWQTALYLDNGDGVPPSDGGEGDYLFIFDFNPSSGDVIFFEYLRVGDVWELQTDNSTFIEGTANGNYGEVALNITELVFVAADGREQCGTATVSGPAAAITGGSLASQVKDLIGFPPLEISNCGSLVVEKDGPEVANDASLFDYDVTRTGGAQVHDPSLDVVGVTPPETTDEVDDDLTELDASIAVGGEHTWTNVLGATNFEIIETLPTPSEGWTIESIVCSYRDVFQSGYPVVDVTIYENDADTGNVFSVPPSIIGGTDLGSATCTMTNQVTGIVVAKEALPDGSTTPFPFTVGSDTVDLADGESAFFAFDQGEAVTITEGVPNPPVSPGFVLDDITCLDSTGADVGTPSGSLGVEVTVGSPDNLITCTFTNVQQGRIAIDKQGQPADSPQEFDFTITGPESGDAPDELPVNGLTIPGDPSAPRTVQPGIHTVRELEPPFDGQWLLVDIVCDNEVADGQDLDAQTVQVDVGPGETVNCVFTNNQRGTVTIEKTAVLLDPSPVPGTIDQFDVQYTVTARSESYVSEDIVVEDAFDFPTSLTVVSGPTPSGSPSNGSWDGDADTVLYDGPISARGTLEWDIDVRVQLDLDAPAAERLCDVEGGTGGTGAWNDVLVKLENQTVDEDDACVSFGDPDITVDKGVVGDVTVNPDLTMSVTYSIDVENIGDGPGAYDVSDSFGFPTWVDVTGVTVANTAPGTIGVEDGTFDGDANTAITSATTGIGHGDTHTYAITVTFTAAPTANDDGVACGEGSGEGLFNLASITSTSGPDDDPACIDIPRGQITVTKATVGDTGSFDFSSTVPGTLIDGGSITTTTDDGTISGNTLSAFVTPGSYTVTEAEQAGWAQIATPCGDDAAAVVTDGGSVSCDFENAQRGPVTVTKVARPDSVSRAGETYTVVYDLIVETESSVEESFTLTDTPGFAGGVDITSTVYTDAAGAVVVLPLDGTIAPGETLVYTATFEFTIDGDVSLDLRDCDGTGTATFNSATVTDGVGQSSESNDCVELPDPEITQTKTAVSNPAQPVYLGGNAYSVAYEIVVTNAGEGPGSYTLVEAPDFGDGIDITAMSATSADGIVDPSFALGSPTLASGVDLAADQSDTYVVTVRLTMDGSATIDARNCTGEPGSGAYNEVSITVNGVTGDPADDCVELPDPAITIDKTASADQPVAVSDTVFTAEYTITVDNVGDGPGAYDLVDAPAFGEGATVTNIAVTGNGVSIDEATAGPVTIITGETIDPDEAVHVYTVVVTFEVGSMTPEARACSGQPGAGAFNRGTVTFNGPTILSAVDCVDIPVTNADLAIVKTASVAQVGAGGGFDWTLDITNNGPAIAENVVIGDLVPATLQVTGVSSSDFDCDHSGNDVECTIGSLAVGASGTVTIGVTVPVDAAGGDVTNVGTVESDTPDPDLSNNSDDATVTIVAQAPPTTTLPPVTLPKTGSDATQDIVRVAMLFLLLGGAVVLITRRRRDVDVVMD